MGAFFDDGENDVEVPSRIKKKLIIYT